MKVKRIQEKLNFTTFVDSSTDIKRTEADIKTKLIKKNIMCHMSLAMCHMSCVSCLVSYFMCHVSYVMCHMLRATCHLSFVPNPNRQSHSFPPPANSSIMHKIQNSFKTQNFYKTQKCRQVCKYERYAL